MADHPMEHPVSPEMRTAILGGEVVWFLMFARGEDFHAMAIVGGIPEFQDAMHHAVSVMGVAPTFTDCHGSLHPMTSVPAGRLNSTIVGDDLIVFEREVAMLIIDYPCIDTSEFEN